MSRFWSVSVITSILVIASACRSEQVFVQERTSLWAETRGVALSGNGSLVHAAMMDTTCEFDAATGQLTGDWDMPTDAERIVDGYGGAVLGQSSEGLHLVSTAEPERNRNWEVSGVLDAQLTDRGSTALVADDRGCAVVWRSGTETRTDVPDALCQERTGFAADRSGETAWIASGGMLWHVDGSGAVNTGNRATGVSWYDAMPGPLTSDGDELRLLDEAGAERWSTQLAGDIGSSGGVANNYIAAKTGNELTMIDALTGLLFGEPIGVPRGDLVTSGSDLVAFVTEDIVAVRHVGCGSQKEPTPPPPMNLLD